MQAAGGNKKVLHIGSSALAENLTLRPYGINLYNLLPIAECGHLLGGVSHKDAVGSPYIMVMRVEAV